MMQKKFDIFVINYLKLVGSEYIADSSGIHKYFLNLIQTLLYFLLAEFLLIIACELHLRFVECIAFGSRIYVTSDVETYYFDSFHL